jgi:hypothetical protein
MRSCAGLGSALAVVMAFSCEILWLGNDGLLRLIASVDFFE